MGRQSEAGKVRRPASQQTICCFREKSMNEFVTSHSPDGYSVMLLRVTAVENL
jgi:hypothetical protein